MQLPKPKLRRVTEKLDIVPGLNEVIYESLSLKLNSFNNNAIVCVLYIEEMSIKSHLYYNLSKNCIARFNSFFDQKTYKPANVLC